MRRVERQLSVFFLPLARTSHRFQTTDDLSCFFRPTIPARAAKDARLHRIRDFDFPILSRIFRLTTRVYTPIVFVYYEVLDTPSSEGGCGGQEHLAPLALHRKDSRTRDREDSGFRDSSLV